MSRAEELKTQWMNRRKDQKIFEEEIVEAALAEAWMPTGTLVRRRGNYVFSVYGKFHKGGKGVEASRSRPFVEIRGYGVDLRGKVSPTNNNQKGDCVQFCDACASSSFESQASRSKGAK